MSAPGSFPLLLRAVVISCLAGCGLFVPVLKASTEASFVLLKLHTESHVLQYQAYPEAHARMLFPSGDAWLEDEEDPHSLGLSASPIIERIRIFKIGDARHRFSVTAASVGDRFFIFDALYCRDNSAVMGELIRAANAFPHTNGEALDLVKLYLALSYYRLGAPVKFVALRGSGLKHEGDSKGAAPFSDSIGVAHSPEIVFAPGVYTVDLYTYSKPGPTGGPVTHWKFELSGSRFDEQMAAQHKGPEKPLTDETSRMSKDQKSIRFTVGLMRNGFTDDGATTDLQVWSASDGPGMNRTHYYYKSNEGAEKRMQGLLQTALAVLEDSSWEDPNGKESRKEALIVQIDRDKNLFASQLYEDQNSVLEYSCSCLRSLLLTRDKGGSAGQH